MRTAICPGSFDPVTNGHMDIIRRASVLFDKIIVLVSRNAEKYTLFTAEERCELIRRVTGDIPNIEIDLFDGLTVDYARSKNACALVKGLRAISDFEYEFQMAMTNKLLCPEIETIFLITSGDYMYLSSSIVKEMAQFDVDISQFVPPVICEDIKQRIMNKEK